MWPRRWMPGPHWVAPSADRPDLMVIAEVKRKSPSKGDLAGIADPAALAISTATAEPPSSVS